MAASSPADLADRITDDGSSLVEALEAVQEALARGGISTVDADRVLVTAYPPASPMPAIPTEVLTLTLEARQRETTFRMTVDELAATMGDFGWPFDEASKPGEQLIAFLAAWVSAAQGKPNDIHSFTPLFLAEMAARQDSPVNLAAGDADPAAVGMSLLEVELFTAAFTRLWVFPQTRVPAAGGGHLASGMDASSPFTALQDDPCSKYRHLFYGPTSGMTFPLAQQLGDFGITFGAGESLKAAAEKLGLDGEDFSNAMGIVGILARVWKLVALYASLDVNVEVVGDNPVHKPLEGELLEVDFLAHVGVSDEDWEDYQKKTGELGAEADRIVRDCMAVLGLPTFANARDIANSIAEFAVEWRITRGSPDHAIDAEESHQDSNCRFHLGYLRCALMASSDHSAVAGFRAQIKNESQSDHPGILSSAHVKVCAEVDASQAPTLSTFLNAAQGGVGLADSIAELVLNLLVKLGKPRDCSQPLLEVTFHERYDLHVEYSGRGILPAPGLPKALQVTWESSGDVPLETSGDGTVIQGEGGLSLQFESVLDTPDLVCTASVAQGHEAVASGTLDQDQGTMEIQMRILPAGEFIPLKESCLIPEFWRSVSGYGAALPMILDPDQLRWPPPFSPFRLPFEDGATMTFPIQGESGEMSITVTLRKR